MIQYSNSLAIIIVGCIAACAIGAGATYYYESANYASEGAGVAPVGALSDSMERQNLLTPAYLIAHPSALKAAEIQCQNSAGPNLVAVCDNVHSAESSLLAIQYRNAASGKSQ